MLTALALLLAHTGLSGPVNVSGARGFVAAGSSSSSSSGGGNLTDGGTYTISTSGAGTNANVVIAFLGGVNGSIEAAADGTNATSSVTLPTGFAWSGSDPTYVSTARSFNGSRSLFNRYGYHTYSGGTYDGTGCGTPPCDGAFQWGFRFDTGASGFLRAYTRVVTYKTTGSGVGQIKFQRFTGRLTDAGGGNTGGVTDDNIPNILLNCYTDGIGSAVQLNDGGGSEPNIDMVANPTWVNNGWVMQEYDFTPGTINTANGSIAWRFTNNSTYAALTNGSGSSTSKRFFVTGDNSYRYWIIHHYIANGAQVDGAELNIDRDAVGYFNTASTAFPKNVIACNASTYAASTVCVPEPFLTWSDTTITGTFNKGALTGLTPGTHFWMYVVTGINTVLNSSGIVPTTMNVSDSANDPYAFIDARLAA